MTRTSSAPRCRRWASTESVAHLARQIIQGQPETARLRQQGELELLLAGAERVGDVEHAGIAAELGTQLRRGLLHAFDVLAGDLVVDRLAGGEGIGIEGQLHRVRDVAGQLAPARGDYFGGQIVAFGNGQKLDHHFREVAAPAGVAAARPVAFHQGTDAGEHVHDHRALLGGDAGVELASQEPGGRFQALGGAGGHVYRGALGHLELGVHAIAFHRGEEAEDDPVAGHQRHRQNQRAEAGGGGGIAPPYGPLQQRLVVAAGQVLEPAGQPFLQRVPALGQAVAGL